MAFGWSGVQEAVVGGDYYPGLVAYGGVQALHFCVDLIQGLRDFAPGDARAVRLAVHAGEIQIREGLVVGV